MLPIVIKNSRIPKTLSIFFDIAAITLWPFIICRDEGDETLIRHESIHIRQQTELLVLPFYIIYLFDFIVGLYKLRDPKLAYRRIRFEQEAYGNQHVEDYLSVRKNFAWKEYRL